MLLKKKNVAILLLIVLLCAGLLSGCGGNTQSQTQDQSTGTQAASSTTTTPPVKDDKTVVADLISQGQKVTEMSYDLVTVGTGITSNSKVWYKDQKMKMETTMNGGQKSVLYFDLATDEFIQYLPDQNAAYKMKTTEYEGSDNATPIDYSNGLADTNYTINGSETVNGMKCRVITVSSEEYSAKEWISEDYGIIVKVQQEYEGTTSTMEFKNIKIGAGTVPDSTFDLPSGVDIMDMSDMMNLAEPEAK